MQSGNRPQSTSILCTCRINVGIYAYMIILDIEQLTEERITRATPFNVRNVHNSSEPGNSNSVREHPQGDLSEF